MEEKYPGLLAILLDPYGSLYLNEGMYEVALRFLEDYLEKHGGELEIITLFDENNLEGMLIRATLDCLLPSCDLTASDKFMDSLIMKGTMRGMDGVPGWDVHVFNPVMLEMLKEDCADTAEGIEGNDFYKWQEGHKQFLQQVSNLATELSYAYISYRYSSPSEDELAYKRTLAGQKSYGTETVGGKQAAFRIGNENKLVQNLTKEDIIDVLESGTIKSQEIASALRSGNIKLNVLGDELFEAYTGYSADTMAMQSGNRIYVRSSSASIFSDVVHEGTHAIDFINGVDEAVISSWTGETSAYTAEREFQLFKGFETQFVSEDDMMVHIWSNYNP